MSYYNLQKFHRAEFYFFTLNELSKAIEEAEAMEDSQEDSKAREAGTQPVQVPNNPR
jgi:hypothetical protein